MGQVESMIGRYKKILTLLLVTVMVLSTSIVAFAGEPSVTIEANDTSIELGTSVTVRLLFNDLNGAKVKHITDIDNFEILNKSQSSSTKIINGVTTKESALNLTLMPKVQGEFNLKATVEKRGNTYETNTLTIVVKDQSESITGQTGELFIKTELSKDNIYFGEKAVLSYELYSRYNVVDYGYANTEKYDGFIAKKLIDKVTDYTIVTIDGKQYAKYDLQKVILTPTTAGTYTIPANSLKVIIGEGGVFGHTEERRVSTTEKNIMVKALPVEGRPNNFSGLVGELAVNESYSQDQVTVGDSVVLNIQLSGNVNLDSISEITGFSEDSFNIYQTEKNTDETLKGDAYYASKEFELIMVPKVTGDIAIESIELNYFNVNEEKYDTVKIGAHSITVTGEMKEPDSKEQNNQTSNNIEKVTITHINSLAKDDEYIKVKKSTAMKFLIIVLVIIALASILLLILRNRKNSDPTIEQIYKKGKNGKTNQELYETLNELIKHKYNFSLRSYSIEDSIRKIENSEVGQSVREFLEEMNYRDYNLSKLQQLLEDIYKS